MGFVQKQLLQLQQSPIVKKFEEALKTFHNLMTLPKRAWNWWNLMGMNRNTSLTYNYMLLQEELKVETIK